MAGGKIEGCRRVHNWFECISCSYLCASSCPLEGNEIDVMVELSSRLNASAEAPAWGEGLSGVLDIKHL